MPGDVAQIILGQQATEGNLRALRDKLGLDQPVHIRYFDWLNGIFHGDLGVSLSLTGVPVSRLLIQRGRNSLVLAFFATLFLVPISISLGTIAGLKDGEWLDNVISTVTLIALSLPEFVSGIFLIVIASVWLDVLPAMSSINVQANIFSNIKYLILPTITVSLVLTGYVARMTRASVINAANSDYARTAKLKGLPNHKTIWHILRNALIPTITIIAMNLGWLMGGLIVVENVFNYPGLGRLVLFAIRQRDIPLIQATVLTVGAIYLFVNLLADILYSLLDPQIEYN